MQGKQRGLSIIPFVVLIVMVIIGLGFMFIYNSIIPYEENVEEAQMTLDQHYLVRYQLINDVIDVAHELEVYEGEKFDEIAMMSLEDDLNHQRNDNIRLELETSLEEILALNIQDDYELNTYEYRRLLRQLEDVEYTIQEATGEYNKLVSEYNEKIGGLPNKIVAFFTGARSIETIDLN